MIKIVERAINVQEVIEDAMGAECGAVSVFIGTVRNRNEGKRVQSIYYDAYKKMAERNLKEIAREIKRKWKTKRVSIVHRIGKLKVGEISVVIAIGTPHRKEAFEASRYAIERIKEFLPIWKQEFYAGGKRWVSGKQIRPS
jgi:molybdopterin synthase catalytic subunit